ncbi:hypothetical protein KP509_22G081200 [Ceratopteris richardii]|nr:hypothetical protein KP509_22G081200 [Ceratopteris richardii]
MQESDLSLSGWKAFARTGKRWLSASGAEAVRVFPETLIESPPRYLALGESVDILKPIHARGHRRVQLERRSKPISLPSADCPVEVEQLVQIVRQKGSSANLEVFLDRLFIHLRIHHVAIALHHIDEPESAIRFFNWAAKQPSFTHTPSTYSALIVVLAKAKEFDKIWELLSVMHLSGLKLRDVCFNVTIKAYGEMGNSNEAVRAFRRMQEFGVYPTSYTYNTLLSVLLKSQQLNSAMEIYDEMLQIEHMKTDVFAHSMMISALCKVGRLKDAENMVMWGVEKGHRINTVAWTALIDGVCKAGDIKKGIELFNMMKDMGLEPNIVTYSVIIAGFSKVGNLNDAINYLERMKADGFTPKSFTYTPVLDAFCKAGRIDEGYELLKKSPGYKGSNIIPNCIFMKAYSKEGRMDEAYAIYNEMVKGDCFPNATTYATLIHGMCKAERYIDALSLFNDMKKKAKCVPTEPLYINIVKALAKTGNILEAMKLCEEMLIRGYDDAEDYSKEFILELCNLGYADNVKELLTRVLERGMDAEKITLISLVFLRHLCGQGKVQSAYRYFNNFRDHGLVPDLKIYNTLMFGALKAGDLDMVSKLCSEVESKGFKPDNYTYAILYQAVWKAKNADGLLEIYDHMKEQHVHANPFVLTILVKALCSMDKLTEACDVCSQILRDNFEFSDVKERDGSFLNSRKFIRVRIFVPLLVHLQEANDLGGMNGLWDLILEKGLFSWFLVD